jgi:Zn-dependent peptidase ImmA (M78 family)/predicted secreted protein
MADARAAIMNAVGAAARLHNQYGLEQLADRGEGRIDIFQILIDREIPLLFRPLRGLLGAFMNDPLPGVMITTQRPLAVQRFTAAHELGHALLNHRPSLDDESILRRMPFTDRPGYDLQEVQADAFASELLVPRWLLAKHVLRQGLKPADLVNPEVIYQLSLRMGVSFRAMCYALQHHRAIDFDTARVLSDVPPREIKIKLAEGVEPETWHGDVWVVTERDEGMLLEGSRTDLVILRLEEHSGSGYVWRFDELAAAGLKILEDRRVTLRQGDQIGGIVGRRVTAQPVQEARGDVRLIEVRPWLPAAEPLNAVRLQMDLSGPVSAGLLASERRRLLSVA